MTAGYRTAGYSAWTELAADGLTVNEAAKAMNCSVGTAAKRLSQARQHIITRQQEAAVSLLTHSGITKPVMSRQRWTDVVLGLARAV